MVLTSRLSRALGILAAAAVLCSCAALDASSFAVPVRLPLVKRPNTVRAARPLVHLLWLLRLCFVCVAVTARSPVSRCGWLTDVPYGAVRVLLRRCRR